MGGVSGWCVGGGGEWVVRGGGVSEWVVRGGGGG